MSLFDVQVANADPGFSNLQKGRHAIERQLRQEIDRLWAAYQPFADRSFPEKFARDPDAHFWEMWLTVELLRHGKNLSARDQRQRIGGDVGPDICILDSGRKIWIEATVPTLGDATNEDQVPPVVPISKGGAQFAPRRQVELRISSALSSKRTKFEQYLRNGIVAAEDLCVVAISGAKMFVQSGALGLPRAVTTVYPLGEEYTTLARDTGDIVDQGYRPSFGIDRGQGKPIPRYAFLNKHFSNLSGLIWSRRKIGSLADQPSDLTFVHNFAAQQQFPRRWLQWAQEFVIESPDLDADTLELRQLNRDE